MGIDLDQWTGRIIAQEKGVVRLLPIAERAKALFGTDGAGSAAGWIEVGTSADAQQTLFPDLEAGSGTAPGGPSRGNRLGADAALQSPTLPHSTVCMPPCCCRRAASPTPCGR